MDSVYEFNGELFESEGACLDALAYEYTHGDRELVVDTLENYGFALSDLGVRPEGA